MSECVFPSCFRTVNYAMHTSSVRDTWYSGNGVYMCMNPVSCECVHPNRAYFSRRGIIQQTLSKHSFTTADHDLMSSPGSNLKKKVFPVFCAQNFLRKVIYFCTLKIFFCNCLFTHISCIFLIDLDRLQHSPFAGLRTLPWFSLTPSGSTNQKIAVSFSAFVT